MLSYLNPLAPFGSNSFQSQLQEIHDQYLAPYLLDPLNNILSSRIQPKDVVSLVIVLAIFIVSLKVLDYARRMIMWWVSMAVSLIFWIALLGGGWYVYNVGIEKAMQDVGFVWGLAEGFLVDRGTPSTQRKNSGWQRQQVPLRGRTGHR